MAEGVFLKMFEFLAGLAGLFEDAFEGHETVLSNPHARPGDRFKEKS